MKSTFNVLLLCLIVSGCGGQAVNKGGGGGEPVDPPPEPTKEEFVMGADLSYVNQIVDHGGTYRDSGAVENPYKIFNEYGTDVVRLRLWHNPDWVRNEVYNNPDVPLYSGLADVTESIRKAKEQGMAVSLDFHYSDIWADPGTQNVPEAWVNITDLEVLKDSVYQYTKQTLQGLNEKGLMPEFVQIGNEINCGLMYSNAPEAFPELNVCDGHWANAGKVINAAIQAVREVASNSDVDTKIILHVAQPENVEWWFNNITSKGNVSDFDIIGFSYYAPDSEVPLNQISNYVSDFHSQFSKEVMIVEATYAWTLDFADDYTNTFGQNSLVEGYPATPGGQRDYLIALTQEIIDGGGTGLMYWAPAWITSDMKDLYGAGSSRENTTFFDFDGNVHVGIDYMTEDYDF